MELNMFDLYKKLDLNDQRNELSSLMTKVDKLLDSLLIKNDLPTSTQTKNYDREDHFNMTESDMLLFFYEDLWNIKNKILELLIEKDIREGNE